VAGHIPWVGWLLLLLLPPRRGGRRAAHCRRRVGRRRLVAGVCHLRRRRPPCWPLGERARCVGRGGGPQRRAGTGLRLTCERTDGCRQCSPCRVRRRRLPVRRRRLVPSHGSGWRGRRAHEVCRRRRVGRPAPAPLRTATDLSSCVTGTGAPQAGRAMSSPSWGELRLRLQLRLRRRSGRACRNVDRPRHWHRPEPRKHGGGRVHRPGWISGRLHAAVTRGYRVRWASAERRHRSVGACGMD
jgi:hypothetical protein